MSEAISEQDPEIPEQSVPDGTTTAVQELTARANLYLTMATQANDEGREDDFQAHLRTYHELADQILAEMVV